jgi:DNA-directed RNA polymerase specialized sigma24 family protein
MDDDPTLLARYRAIVKGLPILARRVFLLHCQEDLEFTEIAFRLDVSLADVQQALTQALVEIETQLDGTKTTD